MTKRSTLMRQMMLRSPMTKMDRIEDQVVAMPGVHRSTEGSPVRFEIPKELAKRGEGAPPLQMMHIMIPTILGIRKSLKSLDQNPSQPQTEAPPEFVAELEAYLWGLGASSVGYTRVPERWVFQDKAILHTNAIVMTMEMDKPGIDSAPSLDSFRTVWETYRDLGRIANKGAGYLRKRGFSAHAGPPLNGLALYPPLAQMAGLGWMGASGLIITPEHGPRVRLATIFTSIENLPFFNSVNEHKWVAEYCAACQICIQKCPADAILSQPQRHGDGRVTYVANERCFPYFADHYGCSVCIAVCPFNHAPYETLEQHFVKKTEGAADGA